MLSTTNSFRGWPERNSPMSSNNNQCTNNNHPYLLSRTGELNTISSVLKSKYEVICIDFQFLKVNFDPEHEL